MLTVLQAIELSKKYLEEKGVKEARLNAELLLADILKMKRLELYLSYEKPLSEKEKIKYREYLKRRSEHEPLQYILGYAEFYGERFSVNHNVLIPRPETELLVEKIVKESLSPDLISILDIGTGSGIIPVILKKEIPTAEITAVDISNEALEVARNNSHEILNEDIIHFEQADIFGDDFPKRFSGYNIVVSNPPYVSLEEFNTLDSEVKDFEPKSAVTDNGDGFNFYRRIAELAELILLPKGKLYLEIGHSEAEKIVDLLKNAGLKNIEVTKDLAGIDRIVRGERE
jgi:release factor glutamine methyltransferase